MAVVAKRLSKTYSDRNIITGAQLTYGPALFLYLYFMGSCASLALCGCVCVSVCVRVCVCFVRGCVSWLRVRCACAILTVGHHATGGDTGVTFYQRFCDCVRPGASSAGVGSGSGSADGASVRVSTLDGRGLRLLSGWGTASAASSNTPLSHCLRSQLEYTNRCPGGALPPQPAPIAER